MTDFEKIQIRGSLTEKQAAQYMGVGVEKIIALRLSGELGYLDKFGSIRYPKAELESFMQRNLKYEPRPSAEKYRREAG